MKAGDSTELIPYLTEEFKKALLEDYPQKFKVKDIQDRTLKSPSLEVETKEGKLDKRTTKK